MNSTNNGVSGVAVTVVTVGAVLVWAGVQNRGVLDVLRDIVKGKTPTPGEQKKTEFSNSGGGYIAPSTGGGNQRVVEIAASYKGRGYVFGGGHSSVCPSGPMDCSGYVSCVLNRAGLMTGTLTTDGFSRWGISIPFSDRKPGDIIVWTGGPGGGHMGIIIDKDTMWHSPCTGCGGVQKASYGSSRTGRVSNVRRARNG